MALGIMKLLKFMMGATTTANVNLTNMMALNIVGTQHFARAFSWLTFSFGIFTFFVCLCRVLRVLGLFFGFYYLWCLFGFKFCSSFSY